MKTAIFASLVASAAAFAPASTQKSGSALNAFTAEDLPGALAPVGFFDPLGFAEKADEGEFVCKEGVPCDKVRI